ncbi:SRPBCC family protein [Streptomyces sp. NPDC001848]|uniref:SRPBCC family protein n=1 Tax=Streptomyces sp. NPDC001848 TaxID=3364618 RepID=UPI0036819F05
MAHRLRPVGLGFARTAPVRFVFTGEMAAPPGVVFRALADDVPGWGDWFPAVTSMALVDEGGGRKVRLAGGTRFRETIMAADPDELYAYRVDEATVPGVHALLEEWRLAPIGTGTRVQWTWAADGNALVRSLMRLSRGALARVFRRAVAALDRRLASQNSEPDGAGPESARPDPRPQQ